MTLCPDCDPRGICCDHCAYYNFNGNDQGQYTGNGYCRLHKRTEDPGSECQDYFCFKLLKKESE
jgi:hypothetical protein